MVKKLLIFPGAGNPESSYKKVYDIIKTEAKERGYTKTKVVTWPGHILTSENNETLKLSSSVVKAMSIIMKYEIDNEHYDLIARSYGCNVVMRMLQMIKPLNLKKVILWGPCPYFYVYRNIRVDFPNTYNEGIKKGVIFDKNFLDDYTPIEFMIYNYDCNYSIKISTGEKDKYCNQKLLEYLDSIKKGRIYIYPQIRGLKHEVETPNNEYFDFLFNDVINN